jgi:hypothetical protein
MCTQIIYIFKNSQNGYISATTKSSKLELMQVQQIKYELVLINCHTIVTTGSYIMLHRVQPQHYNLYCHVIKIKLSRANMCLSTKAKILIHRNLSRANMIVFHRTINHATQSYITGKMDHTY